MLTLRSPGTDKLDRLLVDLEAQAPTYTEVGATAGDAFPAGYAHHRYSVDLGSGVRRFERGADGLRQWAPHRRAGLRVHPPGAALTEGITVLVVLRLGLVTAVVPNRIVWAVDEPARFGFAYGSLPGHEERGEEAFLVRRHPDDRVTFDIVVFSRPIGVARLGAPVASAIQRRTTLRYLRGLQDFVGEEP